MADIFGFREATEGGVFDAGEAGFSGSFGGIALIQQWQVQYSQQLQPLYEVGSSKVYWTRSHTAGQLQIQRIVSETDIISQWQGCKGKDLTINASNGTCATSAASGNNLQGKVSLTLKGSVLTGVQYAGQANQAYVTEGVTAMFVALSRK